MTASTDFLHLARPLGPSTNLQAPSTTPVSVTLTPSALLSILDHSVRRPPSSPRVIGTLLGSRSEDGGTVHIASCYAVPHTETAEQVEVDMDYQKQMLSLHLRANPKEVLVGWYATSRELNTFSALIQNFYGQTGEGGTGPAPAVHLTVGATDLEMDTRADGEEDEADGDSEQLKSPEIRAYISAPIGVTAERAADSCLFIPVPCTVLYSDAERGGLEAISSVKNLESRTAPIISDVEGLERSIEGVLDLIDRVSNYVGGVLDEDIDEPSTALGQYLLNTLSLAPTRIDVEKDFNNHIQDVLAISYLANTIRTQIDLSNRLATAALTMGPGTASADLLADGNTGSENRTNERGGRGGGRGRGRGRGDGGNREPDA